MIIRSILAFLCLTVLLACNKDEEDPNARINAEIKSIDEYIENTGTTDEIIYEYNSGMRFVIHQFGNNPPPREAQTVYVRNVTGKVFPSGPVFTDDNITAKLSDVKPEGLKKALGGMMTGTRATIFIPSSSGYGTSGTTDVPANSILIYEVVLDSVAKTSAEVNQFTTDTTAISNFIEDNSIEDVIRHPSGIAYTIEQEGTGNKPIVYDPISMVYKLKLMANPGTILQSNTLSNTSIFGLIDGLKVGLPLLRKGAKTTFYIPSGLGYGTQSQSGIPANSNLIFEIELTAVPN